MSFESKFVASPQGDLHVLEQAGTEENPFFFVHGNSLCARAYLPFLESVGKTGKKVLAADIRGHGLSTDRKALPLKNWDPFVEDAALIIEKSLNFPVTGIGHSMGGTFLYILAARYPHLVSRLILLDPIILLPYQVRLFRYIQAFGIKNWFSLPRRTRKKRRRFRTRESAGDHYRGKKMFGNWPERCLEGFLEDGLKPSEDGGFDLACAPELEARFYESIPPKTWDYAKRVQCPVHVVRAEFSTFFSEKAALLFQKTLPNGNLLIFSGGKHFFPLDCPEKSAELVKTCC